MATIDIDNQPLVAPAITAGLAALRSRLRRYVWLEGCGAAAAWLGAAFWATLVIDWFFEPPAAVRVALLAAVAIGWVAVVVERIGRRAFVRVSDSNAATVLERRFPQLNDSLLTAVMLTAHPTAPAEIDHELLALTCREAAAHMAQLDVRKAFNPRPLRRNCGAAGLLALSVAAFALLLPDASRTWTRRMLLFSDELWPRSTRLEVEGFAGGVQKVARGADVEVVARADLNMPVVPQAVEVRYRTQGGGRGRATMDRRGVARGPEDRFQEYAYTFRSVLADIHFDVAGGDDRVRDRRIQVVDSPTISQMVLDCDLPAYIGRKEPPLPVSGVMQIPAGSRVTVRAAAANKDLVQVQVSGIVDDRPAPPKVLRGSDLTADRRGFSYALGPLLKDTTLLFTLTDADGIRGRDPVRLALVPLPDRPPQMAVQLDSIGTAVTPQARIPAVGRITDDYGLGRAWFEYAVDQQKPGSREIRQFADHPADFPLAGATLEARDLALRPGQKLAVSVKAADLCDLGQGPNVSSSERWLLDVVTPEQLRVMLESRELVLRQRFDAMVLEMTETRDLLARLNVGPPAALPAKKTDPPKEPASETRKGREPGDDEPNDSPARQRVLRRLRVEGALTNCHKSTPELLGLADSFDDIRKELINNRIDTEELKERLQKGIAEPLRRIAEAMIPELERRLEGLQAVLDDAASSPAMRARAQQQADEILLAMRKVRDRMIEVEDFNEAVGLLREIIKTQDQLHQETEQRHKQKIRELLKE
jgi:hypothetical protein